MKIHLTFLFCLFYAGVLKAQNSEPLLIVEQNRGKNPTHWLTVNLPYFRELRLNAVFGLNKHFSADAELGYYFRNTAISGDTIFLNGFSIRQLRPQYQREGFTFTTGLRYYPLKTRIFYAFGGLEIGREEIRVFTPTSIGSDGAFIFPTTYHRRVETPHEISALGFKYGLGMNLRYKKFIGDMQIGNSSRRIAYYDIDSDSTKKLLPFVFIDLRFGYIFVK